MHRTWLLLILVSCANGGKDDSGPGAGPVKAEKTVKGTLTIGGAMTAQVSWKPDLALTCTCMPTEDWSLDATMSDGADTFVALSLIAVKGITLTSGKLSTPEPLRSDSSGMTGTCKPDKVNFDGTISIDLDAKLTGKAGAVTVKGHLDVTCRERL
jgi:hypothetical protein